MAEFIDRELLKTEIRKKFPRLEDRCRINEIVNSIPAADVVEHKIGTWIEIRRNDVNPITGRCGVYVGCSECGAPLPTDSMLDFIDESDCKFCYNCGAKIGEN